MLSNFLIYSTKNDLYRLFITIVKADHI